MLTFRKMVLLGCFCLGGPLRQILSSESKFPSSSFSILIYFVKKNLSSVSPDDLSLRMGEYDLNGEVEPQKFVDRKVQVRGKTQLLI